MPAFSWKVQQGFMLKGALQWALAIPIFLFWIIILVKIAKVVVFTSVAQKSRLYVDQAQISLFATTQAVHSAF